MPRRRPTSPRSRASPASPARPRPATCRRTAGTRPRRPRAGLAARAWPHLGQRLRAEARAAASSSAAFSRRIFSTSSLSRCERTDPRGPFPLPHLVSEPILLVSHGSLLVRRAAPGRHQDTLAATVQAVAPRLRSTASLRRSRSPETLRRPIRPATYLGRFCVVNAGSVACARIVLSFNASANSKSKPWRRNEHQSVHGKFAGGAARSTDRRRAPAIRGSTSSTSCTRSCPRRTASRAPCSRLPERTSRRCKGLWRKSWRGFPRSPGRPAGRIRSTSRQRLNRLLTQAEDEASGLNDEYVSVEHLILAMARGPAARSAACCGTKE